MKVKVTVTGILNLDEEDVKVLKSVSAGQVLDTMRYQAEGMKVKVEKPKDTKVKG